jgi:hypothetical protein
MPINRVQVKVQGAVEPQINVAWGSTVAEAHRGAIVTGIEIHVDQHSSWVVTRKLNIYLLSWRIAVQEETSNKTNPWCCSYLCFEASMIFSGCAKPASEA